MTELEQELRFLKGTRGHLRTKCTKKCNAVTADLGAYTNVEAHSFIDELKELNSKLNTSNENFQRLLYKGSADEPTITAEFRACDEYEDKIINAVSSLQSLLASRADAAVADAELVNQSSLAGRPESASGGLRLPDIPLPEFNYEEGDSFENFISDFEETIFKYPLSNYKRYIYLVRQVRGGALQLIKSLRGENKSYDDAKELLTQAFASPTVQKFDLLKKLANLKLKYSGNCLSFVSEMRVILSSIKSLQVTVDDIAQYFIWNAMPFDLQTQLMTITNNNRPSVQDIQDNIFIAIERFQAIQKQKQEGFSKRSEVNNFRKSGATALSASVGPKEDINRGRFCVLCTTKDKQADHKINRCNKFITAKEKIGKLKSINACCRCGNVSH